MKKQLITLAALAGGFVLGASALVAVASTPVSTWSPPLHTPSTCLSGEPGCDAPVNVSETKQQKNGWLGVIGLVTANLTVASGTPGIGAVLTSDADGNAYWAQGGGGNAGTAFTFINPVTIATIPDNNAVPWTTVNLSASVPATAIAVILQTLVHGNNVPGYNASLYARPASGYFAYTLGTIQTSGSGAPNLSNANQGIFPISVSGSNTSIDYKSDNNLDTSVITLVGYITGAGSYSAIPPLVTSSVGCTYNTYPSAKFTFTGSPSGGIPGYTYNLAVVTSGTTNNYAITSVPGTYSVGGTPTSGTLQVKSSDGQTSNVACTNATAPLISFSCIATVTDGSGATISGTTSMGSLSGGNLQWIIQDLSGGNGTYTYSWSQSGAASISGGTTNNTLMAHYTSTGTKTASVTVGSSASPSVTKSCPTVNLVN